MPRNKLTPPTPDPRQTCPTCGGLIVPERANLAEGSIVGQHTGAAPIARPEPAIDRSGRPARKGTVKLGSTAAEDMGATAAKARKAAHT